MNSAKFTQTTGLLAVSLMASNAMAADITRDVVYGQGAITVDAQQVERDLWMDVFTPTQVSIEPTPAIVMTHGGSFLQGNPRDSYDVNGAQTTSMNGYCELFANQGYTCFAISYRLGTEQPIASGEGYTAKQFPLSLEAGLDQFNHIRSLLNMRILDANVAEDVAEVENAIRSAAEDLRTAVQHVQGNAEFYNINPDELVLGGFSAGATTVLNTVYSLGVPASGLVLLSPVDATQVSTNAETNYPTLIFQSQHDLNAMHQTVPGMIANLEATGTDYDFAWVPSFGHYYPSGATSLGMDGKRDSVEGRIMNFVESVTK